MGDEKKQDSTNEVDEQATSEVEGGDQKAPGSADSAAPADDDIIIK